MAMTSLVFGNRLTVANSHLSVFHFQQASSAE